MIKGKIMDLVFFIHQDAAENGSTLKQVIDKRFNGKQIQMLRTVDALETRLREGHDYYDEIFILLAESKERLRGFAPSKELLIAKRIIFILPDESKPTLSIACRFFPRYFTYVNDTYSDLCAVLGKMMNQRAIYTN
jgi:hypothetical protein